MTAHNLPERDPRVFLAIERTFLAWTRTALALMGFGFVVARIGLLLRETAGAGLPADATGLTPGQSSLSLWLGIALVLLGIAVQGFAVVEHRRLMRRFDRGLEIVSLRWSLGTSLGVALIGIGVAVVVYLLGLF